MTYLDFLRCVFLKCGAVKEPGGKGSSFTNSLCKCAARRSILALGLIFLLANEAWGLGAEDGQTKRVLMISTGSRFSLGFPIVEQSALEQLRQWYRGELEVYAEALDIIRFPSDSYRRVFQDYLRDKYVGDPPDLVMLAYVGNLGTAAKLLRQIFPMTPVVAVGLTEEEILPGWPGGHVAGIAQRSDPAGTIQLMLRLQPEIRRIVLIGGTAEVDREVMRRALLAAKSFAGRVEFEVWDNRSMANMLQAVASLPARTAILFTRMFRDGANRAMISAQAARSLANASKVPVYVMSEPMIGTGAVGGSVADVEFLGRKAGELAHRILNGTQPESLPLEIITQGVPTFDWRALQRWGISEGRLPKNSVLDFRPVSIWERYQSYIIAGLVIILLQAAMIAALLLQRIRRRRAEAALSENRLFMELATEAGGIGLWVRDLVRGDLWANSRMRSFFGLAAEGGIEIDDILKRVHPDDRGYLLSVIERAQETGKPCELEFRTSIPGVPERWIAARGQFVLNPQGRVVRRLGTMIDITELKRAEEKFRLAVEASPSAIVMVNQQGLIMLVNAQTEKLFGFGRDELVGQPAEILVPERLRGEHGGRRAGFFAAPEARPMGAGGDLYARRKDGSEIVVEIGLSPIQTEEGVFILTSILDITARKQAEEELEKERAFLRQVIDIDPNFIFAKDRQGRFTLANRAVADAYGTTVELLLGKTDADFNSHGEEVEFFHKMDLEVMDTLQERFIAEEHVTDAQGKTRWLQTVKRPIIDKNGAANQVLGTSSDITQRKGTEAELQRNRDELAHLTRVSAVGELAASLAHELNQPLTAILSNAQAAQRFLAVTPPDLDEVREILRDIAADDNRASQVIQRLRALVKKEDLSFASLDLQSVINDVVQLLHSDSVLHNIRVTVESESRLPPARGDKVQLQQVMLNLLLNGFDAMKDSPFDKREALIRADQQDRRLLRVAVRDHGIGLAADKRDRIFQPFYSTKRDGLGMGLSVSRSIIEAHGGQLWAENNLGRGATFYFTVPVDESDEGHKRP